MSAPKLAQGHRGRVYTWPPDTDTPDIILPAWSTVSRHITCLQGPAMNAVGDYVRDNIDTLTGYAPDDLRKAVVAHHRKRNGIPNVTLGAAAHSLIEQWLTGAPLDDTRQVAEYYEAAAPYLVAAQAFYMQNGSPKSLFVEHTIFNEGERYAGTSDLIAKLTDGTNVVIDWKTGGVYHEAALQVCAYSNGEWIGTADGTRHDMPLIARGLIVQLKEDTSYEIHPVNLTQALWDAVKGMTQYAAWHAYAKNHAFGPTWAST